MSKAKQFTYKCRLCGELHGGPIGNFSDYALISGLIELLDAKEKAIYRPGASIGLTEFHHCKDGSIGIADIVGVRNYDTGTMQTSP